ncbi:synaptobrevin [Westerdykella ornata]|uniref:Synaptobrevin n=1 Tax=Westerdykella ornata TaxID=318751 RepID=A0A6A6JR39_WESOR|nr:synaptobrevin [Westerdykella ornata]KAF2278735.1 synaptobrevin [Westerdykella ornata]
MQATSPSQYPDTTAINLDRILSRLEQVLLSPESSSTLRKSSFERNRVGANVEYARTLLLSLEHSAATSATSKSKKSSLQADLQQKRELIKQLNQRLYELNQLDDEVSEDSTDSENEDEDIYPSYAPHVKEEAGIEVKSGNQGNEAFATAAQNLASELRRRGPAQQEDVTATGTALFSSRTRASGDSGKSQEALLEHHRIEQESLSTSLLEMAKQLKQQSVHFQNTLEGDKSILERAVEGLDKSTLGMEAAGQRMGTLRRMTEGKGWWDRMKLYALIFGLWIIAFLIVFVGPKIRF